MTNNTVLARVAALQTAEIVDLKALWRDLYGKEPPKYNRAFLVKRLAYRLQELAYGGLSDGARFRMTAILQEIGADDLAMPRPERPPGKRGQDIALPVLGTRLIREWEGERHEVTTIEGGFEYRGRRYRSLSAIARAITGTQWNGPAFFGLRGPGRAG